MKDDVMARAEQCVAELNPVLAETWGPSQPDGLAEFLTFRLVGVSGDDHGPDFRPRVDATVVYERPGERWRNDPAYVLVGKGTQRSAAVQIYGDGIERGWVAIRRDAVLHVRFDARSCEGAAFLVWENYDAYETSKTPVPLGGRQFDRWLDVEREALAYFGYHGYPACCRECQEAGL